MEMTLADELLLISYDDEGVAHAGSPALDYGLAGAVLMELALAGRIDVVGKKVVVADAAPTGAALTDDALARIHADDKGHTPQDWVSKLSKDLRERALERMVEAGVLRRDKDKVLWVIPRTIYPPATGTEPAEETEARARLRAALDGGPVQPRTAALAALVRAVKLEKTVAPDRPAKDTHRRLGELSQGNWAAEAVRRAVQEMEGALVAITAATAATTAAVTNS